MSIGGACVALAFSPDGRRLVIGSTSGNITIWDTATGSMVGIPLERRHKGCVLSVAFSLDGKHIVSGYEDRSLSVCNLEKMDEALNPGRVLQISNLTCCATKSSH